MYKALSLFFLFIFFLFFLIQTLDSVCFLTFLLFTLFSFFPFFCNFFSFFVLRIWFLFHGTLVSSLLLFKFLFCATMVFGLVCLLVGRSICLFAIWMNGWTNVDKCKQLCTEKFSVKIKTHNYFYDNCWHSA